ncbi:RNA-binding protein [Algimonas arctica]|uniref:RNA-binding protein n=1 Tax=Algimonas arctica TaxID=1479486 RepID=UPI001679FAE1|nr:RNA-binding protein [Algimonas arctica]
MSAESAISHPDLIGEDRRGHKPRERRCVASGEVRDPNLMVRFVLSPDQEVVADVYEKLPGRGVWVTANADDLRDAVKRGGFNRGFKAKVKIDADTLITQTHQQLRRRLMGQLTMARKAGRLAYGQTGVREVAAKGEVAIRIEASDGASDGRGKLRTLSVATARELGRVDPPVIGCFSAEDIGLALGRSPVVHAALTTGKMVKAIRRSAKKLSGFEPLIPDHWDDFQHEISLEPPPEEPPPNSG